MGRHSAPHPNHHDHDDYYYGADHHYDYYYDDDCALCDDHGTGDSSRSAQDHPVYHFDDHDDNFCTSRNYHVYDDCGAAGYDDDYDCAFGSGEGVGVEGCGG